MKNDTVKVADTEKLILVSFKSPFCRACHEQLSKVLLTLDTGIRVYFVLGNHYRDKGTDRMLENQLSALYKLNETPTYRLAGQVAANTFCRNHLLHEDNTPALYLQCAGKKCNLLHKDLFVENQLNPGLYERIRIFFNRNTGKQEN